MEIIYHILGICSDTNNHTDILDVIIVNGNDYINILKWLKYKIYELNNIN